MELRKFRGLKNTTTPERFGPQGFLDAADNVDVDDTGKVLTRLGTTLAQAGSYHSLWSDGDRCYVMAGQDMKQVAPDYSLAQVIRLTTARRVSFNRQQNTVYYSNGVESGRVTSSGAEGWGLAGPVSQPAAQPGAGSLPPGRYQYALTFRRSDGFESGTGVAGLIELAAQGGISFSSIEASPTGYDKCIYLSGPNGEELYRAMVVPNAAATAVYSGSGMDLTVRLETQFDAPPPPGDTVECHAGTMYVVAGSVAWHSRPYQLERFRLRDHFLRFPGAVTMFAAVADGIYVSTADATWFLAGTDPRAMTSRLLFDYGAIPGTATKTAIGVLEDEAEDPQGTRGGTAVMWTTPFGACIGGEGGRALNLTEKDYSLPSAARGSSIVRQARGYTQYLTALEGAQSTPSNARS